MYTENNKLVRAIICDLDATLCNIDHRLHLIDMEPGREDRPKIDWDTFFAEMDKDSMYEWCAEVLRKFKDDYFIVFCTGRSTPYLYKTLKWIETNLPELSGRYQLLMRGGDDHRPDTEVKKDLYSAHIRDKYDVLFVLEDRARVVQMWRDLGLRVLHVEAGDY